MIRVNFTFWKILISPVRFELKNFYPRGKFFLNLTINILLGAFFWNTGWYFLLVFLYLTRLKARQILSRLVKNISLYFKRRHLIIYNYLQRIFSFCETAKLKNKIHAFDTTLVRGYGMYENLVNLYKMKSMVMFRNFIAKKGPFTEIWEWMKMAATPHYWFYLSHLSPFMMLWPHWKHIMASQTKKRNDQIVRHLKTCACIKIKLM